MTRKIPLYLILFSALFACALASCQKYKDVPGDTSNPALDRPYCNDPEAVNYNWDFPGYPDSSVCVYPAGVFTGNYAYYDTVYNADFTLAMVDTQELNITGISRTKLLITGLCDGSSTPLYLTASRYQRAEVDTIVAPGQILCRPTDTATGYLTRPLGDTQGRIRFFLTVQADTGLTYHYGSAYKL